MVIIIAKLEQVSIALAIFNILMSLEQISNDFKQCFSMLDTSFNFQTFQSISL